MIFTVDKTKFLSCLKELLINKHKTSTYALKKMADYYCIFKNSSNEMLSKLLSDCNRYNFYLDYQYDKEEYYSWGTVTVYFSKFPIDDDHHPCFDNLNFKYEIKLTWYEHGSTDEYIPRIKIGLVNDGGFIEFDFSYNSNNVFEDWYKNLEDLKKKEKEDRLMFIEDQISKLLKEKEQLLVS